MLKFTSWPKINKGHPKWDTVGWVPFIHRKKFILNDVFLKQALNRPPKKSKFEFRTLNRSASITSNVSHRIKLFHKHRCPKKINSNLFLIFLTVQTDSSDNNILFRIAKSDLSETLLLFLFNYKKLAAFLQKILCNK